VLADDSPLAEIHAVDDVIEELNRLAKLLLRETDKLEATIGRDGDTPLSGERLSTVRRVFDSACRHLTALEKALGKSDGHLAHLIDRFDGASVSVLASDATRRFLDAHRASFARIGVPQETIDSLIASLEEHVREGTIRMDEATTLSSSEGQAILDQLRALRDLLCDIHAHAELLAQIWGPEFAQACIQGIRGACVIVVDITGAMLTAHLTAFALYVAAKSVWSGYRRVQSAVEKIRSRWSALKSSVASKAKQERIKKGAPPSDVLRRKPKNQ